MGRRLQKAVSQMTSRKMRWKGRKEWPPISGGLHEKFRADAGQRQRVAHIRWEYVSYPRFKKEWKAYRQTYHSAVSNDLAARTLRDKCLQGDALQMMSHLDDLQEMWETLDTCYERSDKYMEEALRPIVDFRRYKIADSAALREFYSLLRAAIKGARRIGRIELLINDQTIPKILGKMPYTDWKEWATRRPDWMRQDVATAFERSSRVSG